MLFGFEAEVADIQYLNLLGASRSGRSRHGARSYVVGTRDIDDFNAAYVPSGWQNFVVVCSDRDVQSICAQTTIDFIIQTEVGLCCASGGVGSASVESIVASSAREVVNTSSERTR